MKYLAKSALWRVAPWMFSKRRIRAPREYSIGIYTGDSPFTLRPAARAANPVINRDGGTDAPISTAADPFMIRVDGRWYMYFEVMNQLSWKGEIAYATSDDGFTWRYRRIALREPFHLSYPQVFEWRGDMYMVPETGRANSVRLYRATRFPDRWAHVGNLLEGGRYADSSLFRFDDLWWMLTDAGPTSKAPVLRLFIAESLTGPWREHPCSPIVDDARTARPAGRIVVANGRPIRFAQPVLPAYGTEVRAFEIAELSRTHYKERPIGDGPILGPGNEAWNSGGMHHVDAHCLDDGTWLACVDGCRFLQRNAKVDAA